MKYTEMQARLAREKQATSDAMLADPGLAAIERALRGTFGPVSIDYIARPGAVKGEPVYLKGASLGELAKKGLLVPGVPCFIEPWDRDCWGWGPQPSFVRELAAAKNPSAPAKNVSHAPPHPTTGVLL